MHAGQGNKTTAERRERGNIAPGSRPWTLDGDERMAAQAPSSSSLAVDIHRFARLETEEPNLKLKLILSVVDFLTNRSVPNF